MNKANRRPSKRKINQQQRFPPTLSHGVSDKVKEWEGEEGEGNTGKGV
jgi:hypothetical protein